MATGSSENRKSSEEFDWQEPCLISMQDMVAISTVTQGIVRQHASVQGQRGEGVFFFI